MIYKTRLDVHLYLFQRHIHAHMDAIPKNFSEMHLRSNVFLLPTFLNFQYNPLRPAQFYGIDRMQSLADRIREKRAEIDRELRSALADLRSAQLRLASLQEKADMLDALLTESPQEPLQVVTIPSNLDLAQLSELAIDEVARKPLPNAKSAVLNLLENHPEGLTLTQIVDKLMGKIHTASVNPRAVIRNMVHYLVKRDRVNFDSGMNRFTVARPRWLTEFEATELAQEPKRQEERAAPE